MEKDQSNKKFVCKFCNKRYPCGKSLGGHLRSHRNLNSSEVNDEERGKRIELFIEKRKSKREMRSLTDKFEGKLHSSYVLREKPKKSWRFSDSSPASQHLKICRECGKGFPSVKALCGHMACHSEKEKQKLVMDSESDTESGPRRSKRMKYKALDVYSSSISMANEGSSAVSDFGQDQEEVALCLMMLSRDTSHWGGVNSIVDSSDNNSVKSSSDDNRVTRRNALKFVSKADELLGRKELLRGNERLNAHIDVSDDSDSDSDSWYFENGTSKNESDVSLDGFVGNDHFNRPKVRYGSDFQDSNAQSGKSAIGIRNLKHYSEKILIKDYKQEYQASIKYETRRGAKHASYSPQVSKTFNKKMNYGSSSSNAEVCKHGSCESINESSEDIPETDPFQTQESKLMKSSISKIVSDRKLSRKVVKKTGSRRSRGHECPFCFKIFRSGQALGGHKRIHFVGGAEDRTFVIKQDLPSLLDLNLPAPVEEEGNGNSAFLQW